MKRKEKKKFWDFTSFWMSFELVLGESFTKAVQWTGIKPDFSDFSFREILF